MRRRSPRAAGIAVHQADPRIVRIPPICPPPPSDMDLLCPCRPYARPCARQHHRRFRPRSPVRSAGFIRDEPTVTPDCSFSRSPRLYCRCWPCVTRSPAGRPYRSNSPPPLHYGPPGCWPPTACRFGGRPRGCCPAGGQRTRRCAEPVVGSAQRLIHLPPPKASTGRSPPPPRSSPPEYHRTAAC